MCVFFLTNTQLGAILNLKRHFLNFTIYIRSCFLLMLYNVGLKNSSGLCFVFGPVFFSLYLESGTGTCTSIAFCFNVSMHLIIWVLLFMFIGSAVTQW